MKNRKLGRTQKAILEHVDLKGPVTSQEVGDALYASTSSAAWEGTIKSREVRRTWASRTLNDLAEKGLIVYGIGERTNSRGLPAKTWHLAETTKLCPDCKEILEQDSEYPNDLLCKNCMKVFDGKTLEFVESFK